MEPTVLDNLLYRRQYICGPDADLFPGWTRVSLPDGNTLAAHPELQVTDYPGSHFRFVLIGYLLDPYNPANDNSQVLAVLDKHSRDLTALLEQLYDKSGHYVLFAFDGNYGIVLNDAGG
jgi:hypothetical protein